MDQLFHTLLCDQWESELKEHRSMRIFSSNSLCFILFQKHGYETNDTAVAERNQSFDVLLYYLRKTTLLVYICATNKA